MKPQEQLKRLEGGKIKNNLEENLINLKPKIQPVQPVGGNRNSGYIQALMAEKPGYPEVDIRKLDKASHNLLEHKANQFYNWIKQNMERMHISQQKQDLIVDIKRLYALFLQQRGRRIERENKPVINPENEFESELFQEPRKRPKIQEKVQSVVEPKQERRRRPSIKIQQRPLPDSESKEEMKVQLKAQEPEVRGKRRGRPSNYETYPSVEEYKNMTKGQQSLVKEKVASRIHAIKNKGVLPKYPNEIQELKDLRTSYNKK
jgi:hypothetical protein